MCLSPTCHRFCPSWPFTQPLTVTFRFSHLPAPLYPCLRSKTLGYQEDKHHQLSRSKKAIRWIVLIIFQCFLRSDKIDLGLRAHPHIRNNYCGPRFPPWNICKTAKPAFSILTCTINVSLQKCTIHYTNRVTLFKNKPGILHARDQKNYVQCYLSGTRETAFFHYISLN